MKQQPQWPSSYQFGSHVCSADKENAAVLGGAWRIVVPVRVEGDDIPYVAKVLRKPLGMKKPLKALVDIFRRIFRLDENSREWRFLVKYSRFDELAHLMPKPLAQGQVDGAKAILVERVTWQGEQLNALQFAQQATPDQKIQMGVCIDEISEKFGRHHIVCNDIAAQNLMVSNKFGKLSLVVIDGFGNNHLIPYPIFSKTLNARKIARRLNRTKQRLGLN